MTQIRIGSKIIVTTSVSMPNYPAKGDTVIVRDIESTTTGRNIWLVGYPMYIYLFDSEVMLTPKKKKLWTKNNIK